MDRETRATCESVIRDTGIATGHTVLDFGCGIGNYTIPAAKQVGHRGTVYAIDSNGSKLKELSDRASREHVGDVIQVRHTNGELSLDLPSASVDVVLLYDIFWYFRPGEELGVLLREMRRLLKADGLLSVFPQHIDVSALQREIEGAGFNLQRHIISEVVHDDQVESGEIFTFRKASLKAHT
ncbi:class I SAM-dependent methyltransferase [Chloroflexota bacterium]